ncbi:putative copper resistance protein D [Microbacterium sp. BE35]|uniref:cytochrome c oxidase assembly protein n=1 Tax=Microbacterium sp. BE35 TaxID=2817773 RepID=UPI002857F7A6|nr:cytochrome c oxidase assembly protein [Microbacterium sp. BE35]MDR7188195.1 putative copper resistance protein D [Microbacterium sp. BE35]
MTNDRLAARRVHLAEDRPVTSRSRALIAVVLALGAVLGFGVPLLTVVIAGSEPYQRIHVGFPGLGVALSAAAVTVVADLAAIVTVGSLACLLFLQERRKQTASYAEGRLEWSLLRAGASVWSLAAAVMILVELFDANGVSPADLTRGLTIESSLNGGLYAFRYLYEASQHPQSWTVAFVAASTVAIVSLFAESWTSLLFALWASIIGVLAPIVVGQILVGPQHDFGSDAGAVQTVAMAVALGLIAVSAIRLATGRVLRAGTIKRFFLILTVAVSLATAADVVLALFKLQGPVALVSATAWQIAARSLGLVGLGTLLLVAVVSWRRRNLTDRRIARLVAAAVFMTLWWVAWSVSMTRIPPPQYFVPTSISQNFLGFDVVDSPSVQVLLTHWRPNLLFVGFGVAGVGVYLLAVRILRRRGDRWPAGRTAAWILGWTVAVAATSSGFGKYSGPDFGVHMIVHMALNMLAPLLLVLGGVVTLLLRATSASGPGPAGVHEWITSVLHWPLLRFLYHPLLVFALFVGSYYALYLTGLFEQMVRYHWAHQLMNIHFLLVGYLYYSLAVGIDRPPRPLPHVGKLGFVLAAMPFHAFFGVILMTSTVIVAENFYLYLRSPWADLPAAQYMAGGVAWAGGEIPLMIVVVVLGVQWARQDERQSKRTDRHLDTGLDDEFEEYNRMLASLSARRSPLDRHVPASLTTTGEAGK